MNNIAEFLENNFFPHYKITKISKDDESRHMLICLEPKEAPSCPHCHSHNAVVHDYRKKELKDEKILGYFVTLEVVYRTVKCNYCGKCGTEDISFAAAHNRVTKRAELAVIEDLERAGSIKDTAGRTGIK